RGRLLVEALIEQASPLREGTRELHHQRPQGGCQQDLGRRSVNHRGAPECEEYWLLDTSSIPPKGVPCKSLHSHQLIVVHCGNSAITPGLQVLHGSATGAFE